MAPPAPELAATSGVRSGYPALPVAARRHRLVAALARQLRRRCAVARGATLVVGVSGGADSVALLLGCVALRDRRAAAAIRPVAAHVHHHLRPEADLDAEHVEKLCRRFDVELHVGHVHPGRVPGSRADTARRLRYAALAGVAREAGAGAVAVAHHAEDQLETLLMALGRGSGTAGLSGMSWRRPLAEGVDLVRPLLGARREACESLCRTAGVSWRTDPSNADPQQARGRLRRDVLPVLEALWPDAAGRAAGLADAVRAAHAALQAQINGAFGAASTRRWDRRRLVHLEVPVVAAGLRRAVADHLGAASDALGQRQLIEAAEAITGQTRRPRRYDWPHGLVLDVGPRTVALCRAPAAGA